jgi:mannosyl-oligosaccharide glucosidase
MQLAAILVACCALVAPAFSKTIDSSLYSNEAPLLWGPYRPNLYLGIRPRVPESLVVGLMWGKLDEQDKSGWLSTQKDRAGADCNRRTASYGRAK